jgi:hypothetical protein
MLKLESSRNVYEFVTCIFETGKSRDVYEFVSCIFETGK